MRGPIENVAPRVADRLSFYFRAKCSLTVPGSSDAAKANDLRTEGCEARASTEAQPGSEPATGTPDSDSSDGRTRMIVIGAVIGVLVLGSLFVGYRRSVHARAASDP